jgi:hypothetical protein
MELPPRRQIVIEFKARMLVDVPADWDEEMIEFWANGSCHCLGNFVDQLQDENERGHDGCCFMCHRAEAHYLRDASAEDAEELTPPKPRTFAN